MAAIDFQKVLEACIAAGKTELGKAWKAAAPFAEQEFRQFVEDVAHLNGLRLAGVINEEAFQSRVDMRKDSMRSVLLAVEGIGLIAAQNTINAVLGIVGNAIGKVLPVA